MNRKVSEFPLSSNIEIMTRRQKVTQRSFIIELKYPIWTVYIKRNDAASGDAASMALGVAITGYWPAKNKLLSFELTHHVFRFQ